MLPPLREELSLSAGASAPDGSPTWILHDPVRHQFFQLDWPSFELLLRWPLGDPERILAAIAEETVLDLEPDDIERLVQFLQQQELVQLSGKAAVDTLQQQRRRRRVRPLQWLLHRYLFFRIPLVNPDAFLDRAQHWVAPLYTRTFRILTLVIFAFGLVQASRQFDSLLVAARDLLSLGGLTGLLLALILVKSAHELGHALTAKRYGCRIPSMGVAFLVLFPVAYTDVNDAWRLARARDRLWIGSAGMQTELIIAAWATWLWSLLPDGVLRQAVFLLATTTWVSSVIINATPFLRFDGYFLLMDWLRLPNLHQRAFALGRWRLRQLLFNPGEPVPEDFPAAQRRFLVGFAWLTWIYRLVLFISIAILVYLLFPKPLGPFLAAVELGWFIGRPIVHELGVWRRLGGAVFRRRRSWIVLSCLALVGVALATPWDPRIRTPAVLEPVSTWMVRTPEPARLLTLQAADGDTVSVGDPLLEFGSPDLDAALERMDLQIEALEQQLGAAGVTPDLRSRLQLLEAERQQALTGQQGLERQQERLTLTAPGSGVLVMTDPDLSPLDWVGESDPVAAVIDRDHWRVVAYLDQTEIDRIRPGDAARFYADSASLLGQRFVVSRIDEDAVSSIQPIWLTTLGGGRLGVRPGGVPIESRYRVELEPVDGALPANRLLLPQVGQVVILGEPVAWLTEFARAVTAVWVREANF